MFSLNIFRLVYDCTEKKKTSNVSFVYWRLLLLLVFIFVFVAVVVVGFVFIFVGAIRRIYPSV